MFSKVMETPMLPDDLQNYLSEVIRVLIRGGRYLSTYFLLNDEPKLAIAFNEGWVRGLYREQDLMMGSFSGRALTPNRPC